MEKMWEVKNMTVELRKINATREANLTWLR